MINRIAATMIVIFITGIAEGEIQLKNSSKFQLSIQLLGQSDEKYRGPYQVGPSSEIKVPVEPGLYRIYILRSDGKRQLLPWREYQNLTYEVSLCAICAPAGAPKPKSIDTLYAWSDKPHLHSRASYRLGASVSEDERGMKVTSVELTSPVERMQCTVDGKLYRLREKNNIITHINDIRITSLEEFEKVITNAGSPIKLTIYRTNRGTSTHFQVPIRP